jgi:hypothetical protein
MRLGKLAVIGLAALVGLGLGLIVAQPWHGPTEVEAPGPACAAGPGILPRPGR